MSAPEQQVIRIGLYMNSKKFRHGWVQNLINQQQKFDNVVVFNMRDDLTRPVDVVLQKITDILGDQDSDSLREYQAFQARLHDTLVIDPLMVVEKLLTRDYILDQMSIALDGLTEFRCVNYTLMSDFIQRVEDCQYPIITKNVVACAKKISHQMTIMTRPSRDKINQFLNYQNSSDNANSWIVQPFLRHGGVLVKLYAIGSKIHIEYRPSVRSDIDKDLVQFNSQQIPKQFTVDDQSQQRDIFETGINVEDCKEIKWIQEHQNQLRSMIDRVSQQFGITLFGLDVIVVSTDTDSASNIASSSSQEQMVGVVVDLNYFPSFNTFPNVEQELIEHCVKSFRPTQQQVD
ncbi:hypothetical protein MIR68_010913 [Amoeboaphelidium protococcarum]|nr:hypothetical protein MIR68_010913 [Amoeboaphelidium protococcarum]